MKMRYAVICTLATICFAGSVKAQEIDIRLSIKYILDINNVRPPGYFATEQNIIDTIDETNVAMRRFGRGYRFVIVGNIEEVREDQTPLSNSSDFFNIDQTDENLLLENAAKADPAGYHWRTDAVNIYVVNCCGGGATIPSNPHESGYGVVFMSADNNYWPTDPNRYSQKGSWLHELGHHFNLIHPWEPDDGVADTRVDANPFQCQGALPPNLPFPCNLGGSAECCCSTKVDNLQAKALAESWTAADYDNIRFNAMGYMGAKDCVGLGEDMITFDNVILTQGQLDRFTDASRYYHSSEVSGLTYFVDGTNTTSPFNGYSTDPYRTVHDALQLAGFADIVAIRPGVYPENIRMETATTLRAVNGVVRIGQ